MAAIAGIGTWYPEQVRTNADYPDDFGMRARKSKQRVFNDIPASIDPALRLTEDFIRAEEADPFLGVKERRVASEKVSAVEAEVSAAARALEDAELAASDIDCVISYAAVPDRPTPPSASAVADSLGITGAQCWGIDVACASSLVQLATASALVDSGQAKHVLLTQSHLMLRAFPLMHPASPCLGDASTALVVSKQGKWPILASYIQTHGEHYRSVTWVREKDPGEMDPGDTPWWNAGGAFRVGSLDLNGAKVLQRDTVAFGAQTIRQVVERAGLQLDQIGLLACAQPRGWVPQAILQVLGLPEERATSIYATRAHLGASGCIANLDHAYRTGRTRESQFAALYAQGAGFTRAGVVLRLL